MGLGIEIDAGGPLGNVGGPLSGTGGVLVAAGGLGTEARGVSFRDRWEALLAAKSLPADPGKACASTVLNASPQVVASLRENPGKTYFAAEAIQDPMAAVTEIDPKPPHCDSDASSAHVRAKQSKDKVADAALQGGAISAFQAGTGVQLVVPAQVPVQLSTTAAPPETAEKVWSGGNVATPATLAAPQPGKVVAPAAEETEIKEAASIRPELTAGHAPAEHSPDLMDFQRLQGSATVPGSIPEADTGREGKQVQSTLSEAITADAVRENTGIASGEQRARAAQKGVSADAVLNRRADLPSSARSGRSVEAVMQGVPAAAVQSVPGADPAAVAHSLVAGQSGEHPSHALSMAAGEPAMASHEPFAALDGGPSAGGPTWIHAGARHAEAGFQDPALGWVGVRADLGAGGVHAAIVAGSTEAAQALGGHLAGLQAHLADQQIPVHAVSLSAESAGMGQGGLQQGSGESGRQGSAFQRSFPGGSAGEAVRHEGHSASSVADGALVMKAGQGTHISVVA